MPVYAYSAFDPAGKKHDGRIEASDPRQATQALHARGLLVYRPVTSVDGAKKPAGIASGKSPINLSLHDHARFARQLASLVQSELPLDQCLKLVASNAGTSKIGQYAEYLAGAVTGGRSLSEAIDSAPAKAPNFIAPVIRAAEARGRLAPGLNDLAKILEQRVEVRNRLRGAFTYPAILLVVAVATIALVVGLLVPTLMPLFKDTGADPPWVLWFSDLATRKVSEHWVLTIAALAGAIGSTLWFFRLPSVRAALDRMLFRIPAIGNLMRGVNVAVISRTLGMLLKNGVPLSAALQLAARVGSSAQFQNALESASQSIKEGHKLAAALEKSGTFPDIAQRFIAIGEESSRLDEMLIHLADITEADNNRQIETLLSLLTPAITLLVGAGIGGIMLSVMQAVLSVNEIAIR